MKITVDLDIAAEELRRLFGLLDVEAFNRQSMDDLRERMLGGAEGYDPIKVFQPYMSGTLAAWDMFQKMLASAARVSTTSPGGTENKGWPAGLGPIDRGRCGWLTGF